MKTLTALFGIILCLAVVGPSSAEPNDKAEHEHHRSKQIRHRPKRQFTSDYGYHNPPWQRPFYYPEQQRDDRTQQDLLPHIYRLLEEINDFVRRPPPPPPPPQPIYIPYPVQVPQYCVCRGSNRKPNITNRFPAMEDTNQNWGYDDSQDVEEDYSQNTRPINFDPIPPKSSSTRPPPEVDHGTNQAASDSTKSPRLASPSVKPRQCESVVLTCCHPQDTRQKHHTCFTSFNCGSYFEASDVCSKEHVQKVLDWFISSYSPKRLD